ncbi:Hypothetical predicted protein [Mytilus galloprovincialis]|uniref:Uncharacterized protein n=2 Tax=Mytilus galloprovincialis TaxID=29158 RepID=A0A8B6FD03_MYTGA|nr:Hypothetical predicted protein [Mytilus galloprovincialis]
MLVSPWFQKQKDLLQMMLNAHNDKDVNDDEAVHQYEKDPEKWEKRGLTLDEITGNAILFLLVGYDTTASALTFVSYCLATNPDCQEKLIKEIDSVIVQIMTISRRWITWIGYLVKHCVYTPQEEEMADMLRKK